jgi:hypothetical protein
MSDTELIEKYLPKFEKVTELGVPHLNNGYIFQDTKIRQLLSELLLESRNHK